MCASCFQYLSVLQLLEARRPRFGQDVLYASLGPHGGGEILAGPSFGPIQWATCALWRACVIQVSVSYRCESGRRNLSSFAIEDVSSEMEVLT